MLSVLIPTYNYNIKSLVKDLLTQACKELSEFEIIVAEDASNQTFKNASIKLLNSNVRYLVLKTNIGRSEIRNFLVSKAKYELLLFLDADEKIVSDHFIHRYLRYAKHHEVICGGRCYETKKPKELSKLLRWKIGKKRECWDAENRNQKPYETFLSNNFLIKKHIFNIIKFHPLPKKYGYEDNLFAQEIKNNHIGIFHIKNPTCHLGLEKNTNFLKNHKNASVNLLYISHLKNISVNIKLLNYFLFIKKLKVHYLLYLLFLVTKLLIIKNLMSKRPSVILFDFYKLGMLCVFSLKKSKN